MNFADKVIITTGSASGIGAACALKFAEVGANVVINYSRSKSEAEAVEAECKSLGAGTLLVQADVGNDEDCRRIVEETMERWGRIDVLVNNAGITRFANHANLDALSADDFSDIYNINVVGAYQMIRAVTPAMQTHGEGAVVNISSIAGVAGIGSSVAYAASKGALNTMTISLARSLGPAIRVNAVCPGFVGTRWFLDRFGKETFDKLVADQESKTPLKRAGTPNDVANVVLFFASPYARHITGETLLVDAGAHLDLAPLVAR